MEGGEDAWVVRSLTVEGGVVQSGVVAWDMDVSVFNTKGGTA